MPRTEVRAFKYKDRVQIWEWLTGLEISEPKVFTKCYARLKRLAELGSELRRPESDMLRDGIRELRIGFKGMNYRILYFFYGKNVVCVSHGLTKEDVIPEDDIQDAIKARKMVMEDPNKYTME